MIWELAYRAAAYSGGINFSGFPAPVMVLKKILSMFHSTLLVNAILESMKTIAIGYSISVVIGMVIGLIVARFKVLNENFSALFLGLQTLPNVCWLPFAALWYGYSQNAIIFIIAIGSIFAMSLTTLQGINGISPSYIKAAQTMGAKGLKAYYSVIIPASFPAIVLGMKQAWLFAWRALISGEMLLAANKVGSIGLGQVLMRGRDSSDMVQIAAVMAIIILLGLGVELFVFKRIETAISQVWGLNKV